MNPMNHPMNGSNLHPRQNPGYDAPRSVCPDDFFSRESTSEQSMSNLFFDVVDMRKSSSNLSIGEEQGLSPVSGHDDVRVRRKKRFLLVSIVVLVGLIVGLMIGLLTTRNKSDHQIDVVVDDVGIRGSSKTRASPEDLNFEVESTDVTSTANGNIDGLDAELDAELTTSDTLPTETYFQTTDATAKTSAEENEVEAAEPAIETSEVSHKNGEPPAKSKQDDGATKNNNESPSVETTNTAPLSEECKISVKFHQNILPQNPKITCKDCVPQVSIDGDVAVVMYDDKIFYYLYEKGIWKGTNKAYSLGSVDNGDFDMPFALSGNVSVVGDIESKAAFIIDRSLQNQPEYEVIKLDPPEGVESEVEYGYAVHIHHDTMIIGAPFGDETSLAGTAYVYRRKENSWILEAELDSKSRSFGEGVTIGENIVVVSGYYNQKRTLFLFEYDPTLKMWKKLHHIQEPEHDCGLAFGASLSFTDDNELVVGCPSEKSDKGSLYYYVLDGGKYKFIQKITASDGVEGDFFGDQVSVSDGIMLVGAPGAKTTGHAYIFELTDGVWSEAGIIISPFREDDFGDSLSVSGNKMIISSQNGAYFYTFDKCSQE
ncbi:hypothetical protein ACHAXS_008745 [Conticribra weissflogii]